MKNAIITILLTSILGILNAQNDFKLRANAGTVNAEGYYFSFDIGIPITKHFEIAPTFYGASTIGNEYSLVYFRDYGDKVSHSYGYPTDGYEESTVSGTSLNTFAVLIFYKPLASTKISNKHEILIGAGYGLDRYTRTHNWYDVTDQSSPILISSTHKLVSSWSPVYLKLSYNYYFSERSFVGAVASLNGYDGDGGALIGIQLGTKL